MKPDSRYLLLPLLLLAGCSRPRSASSSLEPVAPHAQRLQFYDDLPAARREAERTGKPLAVFSVLGDWKRHC